MPMCQHWSRGCANPKAPVCAAGKWPQQAQLYRYLPWAPYSTSQTCSTAPAGVNLTPSPHSRALLWCSQEKAPQARSSSAREAPGLLKGREPGGQDTPGPPALPIPMLSPSLPINQGFKPSQLRH